MSPVPILDLTPIRRGGTRARRNLARSIDEALRETGFFVVVGHGVNCAETEETIEAGKRFFDLPREEKRKVANRGTPFRGYVGYGDENLSYTEDEATPPDWKEFYTMGRPDRSDPYFRRPDLVATFRPNVWPAALPALRATMERHYRSMERLTDLVMRGLALALELDEGFFRDKLDRHDSTFRAAHYPHQGRPPAPGQLRAGAHTDYGAITLLAAERAPGGLQIRTRDGAWTDAPVVPEGFVVNIGDLMMTWDQRSLALEPASRRQSATGRRGLDAASLARLLRQLQSGRAHRVSSDLREPRQPAAPSSRDGGRTPANEDRDVDTRPVR